MEKPHEFPCLPVRVTRNSWQWLAPRLAGFSKDVGCWHLLLVALIYGASALACHADEELADAEYRVKAAYIYKFALYVTWPESALALPDTPIIIGVSGSDELATELGTLLTGRTVNSHPVAVRRVNAGTPLIGLHMLFVGKAEMAQLKHLQRLTEPQAVLVITESDGALLQGSMINFVWVDHHIRFEIGLGAAEKSGLKLSSRLLAVAQQVKTGVP